MNLGGWPDNWSDVREEDLAKVTRLLATGPLSVVSGGILARFERAFAKLNGVEHAVATHNGTAAIHVALWAVGVRPGDDVLICDYGFHGMAAAALTLGARLVPCDMDAESFTIDPASIEARRTPSARAVLVHNPWGVPAPLAAIRAATDLPIVADASHAHGAEVDGRPLACGATVAAYSLGLHKLITGGELGCAVTNDEVLRDRMLTYGHVNRVPRDLAGHEWHGNAVGLKLRPHPAALSLALSQIGRFPEKLELLRATCRRIEEVVAAHGLSPQAVPAGAVRSYWKIVLRLDETRYAGVATQKVEDALRAEGIPVEPNHYWPLLQAQEIFRWPDYRDRLLATPCPVAARVTPRTVTLPAPVALTADALGDVASAVARALEPLAARSTSPLHRELA